MKKSQLKKLKCLNATRQIMEMAKKEVPKRNEYDNQESFSRGLFMRCQVEKGILKVSLFLTRDLRIGSHRPVYQVFVDREARDFVTWDSVLEKWREAKVDYLDWPHAFWGTERYIGSKDNKILQTYLGVSEGGYKGLLEYQRKIREEQLKKRHKKQTDPLGPVSGAGSGIAKGLGPLGRQGGNRTELHVLRLLQEKEPERVL